MIDNALAVRAVGLYLPTLLTLAAWLWTRPSMRERAGVLLACIWNLVTLLTVNGLAPRFGWWSFDAEGGLLMGMPVDLYLGWVLFWGAVPALGFRRVHLALVVAVLVWLDLVAMPQATPVVRLGANWLLGEAAAVALCLVPSQLLARWTAEDQNLGARACLQVMALLGPLAARDAPNYLGANGRRLGRLVESLTLELGSRAASARDPGRHRTQRGPGVRKPWPRDSPPLRPTEATRLYWSVRVRSQPHATIGSAVARRVGTTLGEPLDRFRGDHEPYLQCWHSSLVGEPGSPRTIRRSLVQLSPGGSKLVAALAALASVRLRSGRTQGSTLYCRKLPPVLPNPAMVLASESDGTDGCTGRRPSEARSRPHHLRPAKRVPRGIWHCWACSWTGAHQLGVRLAFVPDEAPRPESFVAARC